MAADVDKRFSEDRSKTPPRNGHQNREGSPPGPGKASWMSRGIRALLFFAVVPLLAFGIKYYQDAQLLKRHVRVICITYMFVNRERERYDTCNAKLYWRRLTFAIQC